MSKWTVDATSEPGVLRLKLEGELSDDELRDFVEAHDHAIRKLRGKDYKVWCDISRMLPLSQLGTSLFEQAKRFSSAQPNFLGSAVFVSKSLVAMQHRRTSIDGGVMDTELISDNLSELREHLRTVNRRTQGKKPSSPPP